MIVEQAIFTSSATSRSLGYQLVARSPGVCEADARELTVRCPSHDALLEGGRGARSVNFHTLESGAYCVSQTTSGSAEYSRRGGLCVTTHSLIVSPALMGRFANHPFAVLRAAIAGGALDVGDPIPEHLPAFQLPGRAPVVDREVLYHAISLVGIEQLAALLHVALAVDSLGLVAEAEADCILAALLNCLPVELRPEMSFSTGLKYSPRRPFRWFVASGERGERRRLEEQFGVTVVELDASGTAAPLPEQTTPAEGWAGYIAACLRLDKLGHLEAQLTRPRPGLTLDELEEFGEQFTGELLAGIRASTVSARPSAASRVVHAHAAHERHNLFAPNDDPRYALEGGPSQRIHSEVPEVVEQLETLDDTVYDAISGKTDALARLRSLWPEVLDRLGYELVEPSREQYLRFALSVWHDCIEQGDGGPEMAIAVLGVLEVLCEE